MIRVGLNGFGRIGRVVTRILAEHPDIQLVVVNELDTDVANFAYLLKYDSLYGRFAQPVEVAGNRALRIGDGQVDFVSYNDIRDVGWNSYGVDVVIEATGVNANGLGAHELTRSGAVPKVVVTNAHREVDATVIMGVNDDRYDPAKHHVISSSICDANAVAPLLHHLDKRWGIEAAYITTLHPWLSYQNLLDGPISSVASPGHSWRDYSLGRASVMNLIPKDTTAAWATIAVLPALAGRVEAISFRVPTHLVSASDVSIKLKAGTSVPEINAHFNDLSRRYPRVLGFEMDHLVSSDYMRTTQSCIVDGRRTRVLNDSFVKMVTWYDNEWGYGNRVVDVVRLAATPRAMEARYGDPC
jgi:glyceraldehyde 3-phosphate dehydrogenase